MSLVTISRKQIQKIKAKHAMGEVYSRVPLTIRNGFGVLFETGLLRTTNRLMHLKNNNNLKKIFFFIFHFYIMSFMFETLRLAQGSHRRNEALEANL